MRDRFKTRRANLRSQEGIAIPMVLWLVVVILAMTVVAARGAIVTQNQAQRTKDTEAALQAADAALNYTLFRLNQAQPVGGKCPDTDGGGVLSNTTSVSGDGWCPADNYNFAEGDAYANVRVTGGSTVTGPCQSLQQRQIVAVGIAKLDTGLGGTGNGTQVTRTVTAKVSNLAGDSLFTSCGMEALDWVKIANRARVNSDVISNKFVKITQHGILCGDYYYLKSSAPNPFPDGPTSASHGPWEQPWFSSESAVQPPYMCGDLHSFDAKFGLAQLTFPTLKNGDGTANVANGATTNLAGTDHELTEVNQFGDFPDTNNDGVSTNSDVPSCARNNFFYDAANRNLRISGGNAMDHDCAATLILTGQKYRFCRLQVEDGARLIIPNTAVNNDSPVKIYIEDNQVDFAGESNCPNTPQTRFNIVNGGFVSNETNDPNKLWIIGNGQRVKTDGSPYLGAPYKFCICNVAKDRYGYRSNDPHHLFTVYAPGYQFQMSRWGALDGAVAAFRVSLSNHAVFTFAPRVSELSPDQLAAGLNYTFDSNSWRECGTVRTTNTTFTNTTC